MDNQSQPPAVGSQPTNPQPIIQPTPAAAVNRQDQPKLDIPDDAASALLTINNLQAVQQPKAKLPVKLLLAAFGLIVIVVLVSLLIGAFKPGTSTKPSSATSTLGLPNQSSPTSSSDVSNQINQDVKTCSNPVNAATVC